MNLPPSRCLSIGSRHVNSCTRALANATRTNSIQIVTVNVSLYTRRKCDSASRIRNEVREVAAVGLAGVYVCGWSPRAHGTGPAANRHGDSGVSIVTEFDHLAQVAIRPV